MLCAVVPFHAVNCCRTFLCRFKGSQVTVFKFCMNSNPPTKQKTTKKKKRKNKIPFSSVHFIWECRFLLRRSRFLPTSIISNETSKSKQTHKPLWTFKHQQEKKSWHLHKITRTLDSHRLIYLHAGNTCLQREGVQIRSAPRNMLVTAFFLML